MKFTQVEIENFLAIGEARFSLDGIGLVHICGVNNDETSADSNGSGKSSIGDAISWCLWGATARGVSADDVVNTSAGKNCVVAITIDDDGALYRVTRYRKHQKQKNALQLEQFDPVQQEWIDQTKGTAALTQEAIERLLGCSEAVFNSAVYSGQENIPDIPRMTDRQLKILVEQAAGVDVLTTAHEIARAKLKVASDKRAQAQIAFDRMHQRHQDALASLTSLTEEMNRWNDAHKDRVEQLKRDTQNAFAAFKNAEATYDPAEEAKVKSGIGVANTRIAAVNGERKREELLLGEKNEAAAALNQANTRVAIEERSVKSALEAVRAAEAKVEAARNSVGRPCNSCARPLEESHLTSVIAAAQGELELSKVRFDEASARLADAKAKVPKAEKLVQNAHAALEDHRATMTDVSEEGARLRALQRELQLLNALASEIAMLKQKATNIAEKLQTEMAAENPYADMIEKANQDIVERADALRKASELRDELAMEEEYAQTVVDIYAPAGVRAHRLDEATPYLNDRTAHYLGSLADGAIDAFWTTITETKTQGRMVEKFSVTVEKQGSAPSFNALSGGEKRKVRLACALALQDLVAARAAKNIELWLGDEVDDALDAAGLERLMGVLEEKARERGTVLIISHNDIAHYARQQMLVEKKNGRATVTVS